MKYDFGEWDFVRKLYLETQSIKDTASKAQISRSKVRKILITTGDLKSPIAEQAIRERKEGKLLKEIAEELGISESTLCTYLPYDLDEKEKSENARRIDEYRERIRVAKQNMNKINPIEYMLTSDNEQLRKWAEDYLKRTEESNNSYRERYNYPGTVLHRDTHHIETNHFHDTIRLHLELEVDDEETVELLKKYGDVKYGDTISRDVVVPYDMQLWAIHYMIQRAFGWQNSHLHRFILPDGVMERITDNKAGNWANLIGEVFRSPFMDENAEFWADDYKGGSFKNWLKKKYTGPTISLCQEESYWYIREQMIDYISFDYYACYKEGGYLVEDDNGNCYEAEGEDEFELILKEMLADGRIGKEREKEYVLVWSKGYDGQEFISDCYLKTRKSSRGDWFGEPSRTETVKFKDLPIDALGRLFDSKYDELLERSEIGAILYKGEKGLLKDGYEGAHEVFTKSYKEVLDIVAESHTTVNPRGGDTPLNQPFAPCVTDEIIYEYDFGDNWRVRITASQDACDLIESGRITDEELGELVEQSIKTYSPVMIARDGMDIVDDMGGASGIGWFLNAINETGGEVGMYEGSKEENIAWAKSLGWNTRNVNLKNRL